MTDIAGSSYIGQKFCDRYQVVRELGRGGMGIVFPAHDEHLLNRPVVLKVLQDKLLDNPEHGDWVRKKFAEERAALDKTEKRLTWIPGWPFARPVAEHASD